MAEFVTVMSEFMRLCISFEHCVDCPVYKEGFNCDKNYEGYSKTGAAELEHIIMAWAAEHPEPVYPTWWEWLTRLKVIFPAMGNFQKCVDDLATTPIPADIAEKLGIEPKEG